MNTSSFAHNVLASLVAAEVLTKCLDETKSGATDPQAARGHAVAAVECLVDSDEGSADKVFLRMAEAGTIPALVEMASPPNGNDTAARALGKAARWVHRVKGVMGKYERDLMRVFIDLVNR